MKELVLIADDEREALNLVSSHFRAAGFHTLEAVNGAGALALIRTRLPSIAILDLMTSGMTGIEVLRTVKRNPQTADIPVVLLTACATETDRVVAFELGADDYVGKPFSPRELVLRVRGILRHGAGPSTGNGRLKSGSLQVDLERHAVMVQGRAVDLTGIEFKLLAALLSGAGRALTREQLLASVWESEHDAATRTVDTHIRRLRDKLGSAGDQIHTVRKVGYRLDEA